MKKALVFYLYGNRNAGDMAICMGTIEYLKQKGYDITMVSRFSEEEAEYQRSKKYVAEYYPEVKVYPGPFSFERDYSKLQKLIAYGKSYLKVLGVIADKQTKDLIRNADVVFFNGGNLLRAASMADYLRLVGLFYPIEIARKIGKTVYCLPQSTAKISNAGEKLIGKYLKCFDKIFVREKISFDELSKRFPDIPFARCTDMAFLCSNTKAAERKFENLALNIEKNTIAIVVRNTSIGDIGELEADKQEKLLSQLATILRKQENYQYLIVVQTEKDKRFSQKVLEMISASNTVRMIESHDPLVLREIYKRVDGLVTMRLHAAILSLSAFTPVLGIFSKEWGLKNPGIMRDYGMNYWIVEDDKDKEITMSWDHDEDAIRNRILNYSRELENVGGGVKRHTLSSNWGVVISAWEVAA